VHTHPFDQIKDIQRAIQIHLHGDQHITVIFIPGWLALLAPKDLKEQLLEREALQARDFYCVQVVRFFLQSLKLFYLF